MGIEEVFDVGNVHYVVEFHSELHPCEVVRQRIGEWLKINNTKRAPVWVYYKKQGFFRNANVQDAVCGNEDGSLNISRWVNGRWERNIKNTPLARYLEGTDIAYVQLRAYDGICFGVKATSNGAAIGYYDFSAASQPNA